MKKWSLIVLLVGIFIIIADTTMAQCSICTKTAQQMGERPAKALNFGILYLAMAPISIFGYLGYKWYKNNMHSS